MAQLARIGTTIDQRQGLKKDLWSSNEESKEEDRDNKEGSENGPKGSQRELEKGTSSSTSYQNSSFFYITLNFISLVLLCLYCMSRN